MKRKHQLVLVPVVLILAALSLAEPAVLHAADTQRQRDVAQRGAQVMPFDLEQTIHVFQPLDDGGVQRVTAKDPKNKEQIALIRAHLKDEASRFHRGDFSDPAKIHGADMPGLAELSQGAAQIGVRYTELSDGAEILYTTKDPALIAAIHHWFQAQLHDHGHHAATHRPR